MKQKKIPVSDEGWQTESLDKLSNLQSQGTLGSAVWESQDQNPNP